MIYEDALKLLTSTENFYIDLSLDRITEALARLGNPQDSLKCIHVAGTNGKGSVCAILNSILQEAGYKTGLYTSPHIWEYTERIKICGKQISKQDFADLVTEIVDLKIHLTEFEIITIVMFLYFKRNNVEIAILETGLGGRYDATNVIKQNLCSIITQIDLDHTDRLGKTKDEIAFEKAGIIKPNCPIITGMGFEAIHEKADKMNSLLIMANPFVKQEFIDACTLKGVQQADNLALAINAINYLFKDIADETIIEGLQKIDHPCRFEYIKENNLILDASHNPNSIQALKTNLDFYFYNQPRRFVFGALKTKDYEKMMNILFEEGDEVYLFGFDYPNAASYEELRDKCPVESKEFYPDLKLSSDKLNIICGSFYMIEKILPRSYRKND